MNQIEILQKLGMVEKSSDVKEPTTWTSTLKALAENKVSESSSSLQENY